MYFTVGGDDSSCELYCQQLLFVFKLELMESFGSTRYDGAIGSALLDANIISLYQEEITAQIYFKSHRICKPRFLHCLKPTENVEICFLHTSSRAFRAEWLHEVIQLIDRL